MHIKKGDTVTVLSGDDKGKISKVVKVFPRENRVVVEGINMVKKHEHARKQGQKGQVVEIAMPMAASKLSRVSK